MPKRKLGRRLKDVEQINEKIYASLVKVCESGIILFGDSVQDSKHFGYLNFIVGELDSSQLEQYLGKRDTPQD